MKSTMSKMKNTLDEINGRLDTAEKKMCEHEGIWIEVIQNERDKKESKKKKLQEHQWIVGQFQMA